MHVSSSLAKDEISTQSILKGSSGDLKLASHNLGHVVRMQEEIGTGGAGFRYLFAAFLKESHDMFGGEWLLESSELMTTAGNRWRDFAVEAARVVKNVDRNRNDFKIPANIILECAELETKTYSFLAAHFKELKYYQ